MSVIQQEDRDMIGDVVERFVDENYPFEKKQQRLDNRLVFGQNWPIFSELGWLALPLSVDVGGLGGSVIDAQVVMRAFGRGLIEEPYLDVVLLAAKCLEYCVPEQAENLIEKLLFGNECAILAHGEVISSPNFHCVRTTATKSDGGYRLNGTKRVIYHAKSADYFLLTALLDEVPALFRVDATIADIQLKTYPTIDSHQASDICFDQVEVSSDALLGVGENIQFGLNNTILFSIAAMLGELEGIAVNVRKMTSEYLDTRQQFGRKIGEFQALQHKLADMVIAEEEIRSLAWMTSNAIDIEDADERTKLIRLAKARAGKVARQMVETGVQLHGGIGVTDELIMGHYLRRVIALDAMYGDAQQHLIWLAQQD